MARHEGRLTKHVIGPDGSPLTEANLPQLNSNQRWVIRKKAEVVAAVKGGLISVDDACARYTLSFEEYLSWQAAVEQHGFAALRVTKIQDYRSRA